MEGACATVGALVLSAIAFSRSKYPGTRSRARGGAMIQAVDDTEAQHTPDDALATSDLVVDLRASGDSTSTLQVPFTRAEWTTYMGLSPDARYDAPDLGEASRILALCSFMHDTHRISAAKRAVRSHLSASNAKRFAESVQVPSSDASERYLEEYAKMDVQVPFEVHDMHDAAVLLSICRYMEDTERERVVAEGVRRWTSALPLNQHADLASNNVVEDFVEVMRVVYEIAPYAPDRLTGLLWTFQERSPHKDVLASHTPPGRASEPSPFDLHVRDLIRCSLQASGPDVRRAHRDAGWEIRQEGRDDDDVMLVRDDADEGPDCTSRPTEFFRHRRRDDVPRVEPRGYALRIKHQPTTFDWYDLSAYDGVCRHVGLEHLRTTSVSDAQVRYPRGTESVKISHWRPSDMDGEDDAERRDDVQDPAWVDENRVDVLAQLGMLAPSLKNLVIETTNFSSMTKMDEYDVFRVTRSLTSLTHISVNMHEDWVHGYRKFSPDVRDAFAKDVSEWLEIFCELPALESLFFDNGRIFTRVDPVNMRVYEAFGRRYDRREVEVSRREMRRRLRSYLELMLVRDRDRDHIRFRGLFITVTVPEFIAEFRSVTTEMPTEETLERILCDVVHFWWSEEPANEVMVVDNTTRDISRAETKVVNAIMLKSVDSEFLHSLLSEGESGVEKKVAEYREELDDDMMAMQNWVQVRTHYWTDIESRNRLGLVRHDSDS